MRHSHTNCCTQASKNELLAVSFCYNVANRGILPSIDEYYGKGVGQQRSNQKKAYIYC